MAWLLSQPIQRDAPKSSAARVTVVYCKDNDDSSCCVEAWSPWPLALSTARLSHSNLL